MQDSLIYAEIFKRYTLEDSLTPYSYSVYLATHKEMNITVSLKVLLNAHPDLQRYLRKLKEQKHDNIIKIYEYCEVQGHIFLACEVPTFSTLKHALSKCHKLEDADCIFISKVLLQTHVDLLRVDLNWFGTEDDIEFTDNGLKLSWNNSIPFTVANPFPRIISQLSGRLQSAVAGALPISKNKIVDSLITVSELNASEISLDPNMKKKEKPIKRKGNGWVGLRESKNDFEYYEQIVVFAVHESGFVRVKIYPQGTLNQGHLSFNKVKNTFTKVLDVSSEAGKTVIVSEYSNGGNAINYFSKLKSSGLTLNENHIEFIFASLLQPLKEVQLSEVKSLGMVHIKNIYLENGIPKIGEPVPINSTLTTNLNNRVDVPDFYHSKFKRDPGAKDPTYDTYSLGVLLYKLMFTEYPIFPQGKVHIPTTPVFSKRLKQTLEIILNEGGMLRDIQQRIEISAEVTKQVKINREQLQREKSAREQIKVTKVNKKYKRVHSIMESRRQEHSEKDVQLGEPQEDSCEVCCSKAHEGMIKTLDESPYKIYRLWSKILLVFLLYVLLFYMFFLGNTFSLFSAYSFSQRMNVTIATVNYQIGVTSSSAFYTAYNTTTRTLPALQSLGCFIDSSSVDYYGVVTSISYLFFLIGGLAMMIVLMLLKSYQLYKLDLMRALDHSNSSIYSFSNYLIFSLLFCNLIHNHFAFFSQVFFSTQPVCLGIGYTFGATNLFYSSQSQFMYIFFTVLGGAFIVQLLHMLMIHKGDNVKYSRLFNPILLFGPWWLVYWIIIRVGLFSYFQPSILVNFSTFTSFAVNSQYVGLLGMFPEVLYVLELAVEFFVDWVYWLLIDKRRIMLIHDESSANIVI